MALEKKWLTVTTAPFTANGTAQGIVTMADTAGYKVKGKAFIAATGQQVIELQVQRVISSTQLILGPIGSTPEPQNFQNISAYTVAANAVIGFVEQSKNKIKPDDIEQAVYEADPTVALRNVLVDQYGRFYNNDNPLPTVPVGSAADRDWDDLVLTRDSITKDIVTATYKKNGIVVRTLSFSYDSDEDFIRVQKS